MNEKEIDRQIAEKVMGWEWVEFRERYPHADRDYWCIVGDIARTYVRSAKNWTPSTNIAHAFEVVDKMDEDGFDYRILCDHSSEKTEYEVEFYKLLTNGSIVESGGQLFYDKKEKAMAICKAALKAVKGKDKEE